MEVVACGRCTTEIYDPNLRLILEGFAKTMLEKTTKSTSDNRDQQISTSSIFSYFAKPDRTKISSDFFWTTSHMDTYLSHVDSATVTERVAC